MSAESRFLTLLRLLANDPAAQGLRDDVAVLEVGGARLILTSDTMEEGVHHLPADPPADIGWKLAAVNLSDLAAKGAKPLGCLLNYALSGDESWDRSEEHTSELQSLMRISYAVFCLKKQTIKHKLRQTNTHTLQ